MFGAIVKTDKEREQHRLDTFAYLTTMALLVLRGDATMSEIRDIGEGSSYIANLRPLAVNAHSILLSTDVEVLFGACDPSQLAEALLIELAGFKRTS